MYRLFIFFILPILIAFPFQSQTIKAQGYESGLGYYTDSVSDKRIKTIQLYKEGWNLSYPVIKLNSDEKLILQFDLLDNQIESFDYTFIHCDKDWNRSDIFTNIYLEGFPDNQIEDVRPSFNTTVNYIHYKISFPNDRIRFSLSGNYIVCVYPYGNPDKPVLTQRFVITENIAGINITTHRPLMTAVSESGQQVDFTVTLNGLKIIDPYRDIYSFILQNGRWSNSKKNLKPDLSGNDEVKYNSLSDKTIFNGGNEFRYFDIKSIRYQSEFIQSIDFKSPYYNVFLFPSENRESKPYFYWQDFNGKYYIASQEGRDPETDADYVNVYFTLHSKYKVEGGRMYVSGNLNNWVFDDNNLMIYNPLLEQYECTMLLKQGWYNYEYVFLADGDREGTATKFEGSHYETENDYLVVVYYRNPRERFDRVIGTAIANTLNRLSY